MKEYHHIIHKEYSDDRVVYEREVALGCGPDYYEEYHRGKPDPYDPSPYCKDAVCVNIYEVETDES